MVRGDSTGPTNGTRSEKVLEPLAKKKGHFVNLQKTASNGFI